MSEYYQYMAFLIVDIDFAVGFFLDGFCLFSRCP